MLRLFFLLLGLTLPAASFAADGNVKVAYSRDRAIYVANLDGTKPKKIANGAWPNLSPDGTRLAFNTEDASGKTPDRYIAIAEVATGKVTKVPNIPSKNCHSPLWSPDGRQLLLQVHQDDDWHIGLIGADGSDFRYVKRAGPKNRTYYASSWAPDGKSFFCQDLDAIYRVGLDGEVQKQWAISKLFPQDGLSSACRVAASPDGTTLLIDVEMAEDVTRDDWQGPPPAIWTLKISSGELKRITAKDVYAWQPFWLSNDAFVCNIQPVKASQPSIYRVSLDGKSRQVVIKNARDASVSR